MAAESEGVGPTLGACKMVMSGKQLESMNKQSQPKETMQPRCLRQ